MQDSYAPARHLPFPTSNYPSPIRGDLQRCLQIPAGMNLASWLKAGETESPENCAIVVWTFDPASMLCSSLNRSAQIVFSQSTVPINIATEATLAHYYDLPQMSPKTPIPPKTIKRLFGFKSLQPGWDGYGAAAINEGTIFKAFDLIDSIYKLANRKSFSEFLLWVVPTVAGGVQIEMKLQRKAVEIEINPMKISILKADDRIVDLSKKYEESQITALTYEFIHGLLNWIER